MNHATQRSDIPHFPIIMLGVAILLTLGAMIWIGYTSFKTSKVLEHTVTKEFRALELRGLILEDDAILMKYAQLGVATGDPKWEQRYDALIPALTSLINEAITLAPPETITNTANKTALANQQLILMERQAFLLAKTSNLNEAKKIISGPEYDAQGKLFHEGMIEYNATIQQRAKNYLKIQKNDLGDSIAILTIDFIFLVIAWGITLRNILLWKRELEQIIITEMQYKKEIENARHFLLEMSLINKMNDKLQTCQELKEAYTIISHSAQELFPDLSGGLCLRLPSTNEMETVQCWGNIQIMKSTFDLEDCWALREGHTYIVNDPHTSLICKHFDSPPLKGYICLPLIVQDGLIGMLEFNSSNNDITDYQQHLAITFSEVLRLSIGNIKLRESLNEQAAHDPLTGLYNRRYLNETLPRELQRAIRAKRSLCVAMLDLDFFKKVNDTYGHEAGDEVLKFVAEQLKINLRAGDLACRYGGEEFLLVLVDATIQDAMPHLQQICTDIREAHMTYLKQKLPKITISVGLAEAPRNANKAIDIIRMADDALYKAKNEGRDRIEVFEITS